MKQAFGYNPQDTSYKTSQYHNTHQVLANFAESRQVIWPVSPNRPVNANFLAVARLFRLAYKEQYGQVTQKVAYRRVIDDVCEFIKTKRLPYYVMRRWFEEEFGKDYVAKQMKGAISKPYRS